MSSRRLQDMSSRRLQDMPSRSLQDMSSRRLQDVFSVTIFRFPSRLQDVFKRSSRRLARCLQDAGKRKIVTLKTFWRNLQDQQMFAGVILLFEIFSPSVFLLPFSIFKLPLWNILERNIKIICLVLAKLKQIRNVIAKFRNRFDESEKNVFKERSIICCFSKSRSHRLSVVFYASAIIEALHYSILDIPLFLGVKWGYFNRRNHWEMFFFAESFPQQKAVTKWWKYSAR